VNAHKKFAVLLLYIFSIDTALFVVAPSLCGEWVVSTFLLVLTKPHYTILDGYRFFKSIKTINIKRAATVSQEKLPTFTMISLYFLVLLGFSDASSLWRESNSTNNVTSRACVGMATTTSTIVHTTTCAIGSQGSLFPTNPSLRLPLPLWNNGTDSTRNLSKPTEPSVPLSSSSSLIEHRETLVFKVVFTIAIYIGSIAFML